MVRELRIGSGDEHMDWFRIKLRNLARRLLTSFVLPVLRPVIWYTVFYDLIRQPVLLRYVKTRISLLDQYDAMFPGAKEFSRRTDVHNLAIEVATASGLQGLWMEFGVWNGESINHIAKRVKGETIYGFDSFEGLPVDWWQGRTADALVPKDYFKCSSLPRVRNNVELIKGWFDQTLPGFLASHAGPASFIHIDSDVYDSAKTVLDLLADRIRPGTVIVFDELFNYPCWEEHEWRALQEFIAARKMSVKYLAFNSSGEQVALQFV